MHFFTDIRKHLSKVDEKL